MTKPITRDIFNLQHELDGISSTLSALAYSITDGVGKDLNLTKATTADIIFSCCDHIDRVVQDMERIDSKPQKITETVTKTMYL